MVYLFTWRNFAQCINCSTVRSRIFFIVSGFMNRGVGVAFGEFPRSGNVKNAKVKQS